MDSRYSSKTGSRNPLTFSNITARGFTSLISRSASGKRSLSSLLPNCLPATENGGHGTPPASRSTFPRYGMPEKFFTSSHMTFQSGRFRLRVSQYSFSYSTSARCSNPAIERPNACPPAPAQISMLVNPIISVPLMMLIGFQQFFANKQSPPSNSKRSHLLYYSLHSSISSATAIRHDLQGSFLLLENKEVAGALLC